MNQYLEDAYEELKRADHLLYVSLKYTRTVDIIKSIVERLINLFDFSLEALLSMLKEHNLISSIPKSPGLRANIVFDYYKNEEVMQEFFQFYQLLRAISRAEFQRSSEFRRHVKMTAMLDTGNVEVDIDKISEYYQKSRVFITLVRKIITAAETLKELPNINMAQLRESVMAELDFEKGYGN
jgi:hypothetical protein